MKVSLLLAAIVAAVALPAAVQATVVPPTAAGCEGAVALPVIAASTVSEVAPAAWAIETLADLDETENVGAFGSMGNDRAGLVVTSGFRTWFTRTLDGGNTWSQRRALTPTTAEVDSAEAAFTGSNIDVVSDPGFERVLYRHSSDRGRTWSPTLRLDLGWDPQVARGPGGL